MYGLFNVCCFGVGCDLCVLYVVYCDLVVWLGYGVG